MRVHLRKQSLKHTDDLYRNIIVVQNQTYFIGAGFSNVLVPESDNLHTEIQFKVLSSKNASSTDAQANNYGG